MTLLIVSVLILTVGLAATTRTQNVTVGGYYPGVIVSIMGIGRSQWLFAYHLSGSTLMVFSSAGVSSVCSVFAFPYVCVYRGATSENQKNPGSVPN